MFFSCCWRNSAQTQPLLVEQIPLQVKAGESSSRKVTVENKQTSFTGSDTNDQHLIKHEPLQRRASIEEIDNEIPSTSKAAPSGYREISRQPVPFKIKSILKPISTNQHAHFLCQHINANNDDIEIAIKYYQSIFCSDMPDTEIIKRCIERTNSKSRLLKALECNDHQFVCLFVHTILKSPLKVIDKITILRGSHSLCPNLHAALLNNKTFNTAMKRYCEHIAEDQQLNDANKSQLLSACYERIKVSEIAKKDPSIPQSTINQYKQVIRGLPLPHHVTAQILCVRPAPSTQAIQWAKDSKYADPDPDTCTIL